MLATRHSALVTASGGARQIIALARTSLRVLTLSALLLSSLVGLALFWLFDAIGTAVEHHRNGRR